MRSLATLTVAAALAATAFTARADHIHQGLFNDIGRPPAEGDVSHANEAAKLMVERCTAFAKNIEEDKKGHIVDYPHNYSAGFCLGWINSSMVFLNVRDSSGAPALGVCLPEGIHTTEVVQAFLEFAKQNPDDLKYSPSFLIYWSMLEKYPCKK